MADMLQINERVFINVDDIVYIEDSKFSEGKQLYETFIHSGSHSKQYVHLGMRTIKDVLVFWGTERDIVLAWFDQYRTK